MFVHKVFLPRRTVLKGLGAALALPFLDAMVPALTAQARTAAAAKKRLACVYIPHGVILDQWTPATAGSDFELKPILKPLEPFRQSMVVVTNLLRPERGFDTNHAGAPSSWLTGVPPKRTAGPDFSLGATLDQVVAQGDRPGDDAAVARARHRGLHRPHRRLLARLQLRLHEHAQLAERRPRRCRWRSTRASVFERLFGGGTHTRGAPGAAAHRQEPARLRRRRSQAARGEPRRARPRAARRVSRARARDRAPRAAGRVAHRFADRRAGSAGGRARGVRGSRQADVRPAGDRVRGRPHARQRVHAHARAQPAHLSEHRRHRAAPHDLAPRQQAGRRSRRTPR